MEELTARQLEILRLIERFMDEEGFPPTRADICRVAAGSPILAAENVEARVPFGPAMFRPRAHYLLRVRGLSMKDAGIMDGDLLAVHKTAEARAGQIVVARLGDDVTV